jgi:hypothetical protein
LIAGFLAMMESDEVGPINLGNPSTEFTIINLKNCMEEVVG